MGGGVWVQLHLAADEICLDTGEGKGIDSTQQQKESNRKIDGNHCLPSLAYFFFLQPLLYPANSRTAGIDRIQTNEKLRLKLNNEEFLL